jgi:flagellar assembly protein FliH
LSRSPLLRGTALAGAPLEVPLRPRPPARPADLGSPQGVLDAARREAESMLAAAEAEAGAARRAAHEEGFAAGMAEAAERTSAAMGAIAEMAGGLDDLAERMREDAVCEATGLAVEVAAKLVRAEMDARPERVADVLRGAIRRAADRSALVARVSPDDLAVCRAAAPRIMEAMGGISKLEVVDDPRLSRGSCVLETNAGDVDATFESQLARVLEALAAPPDEALVGRSA